jgi:hypothetical protein
MGSPGGAGPPGARTEGRTRARRGAAVTKGRVWLLLGAAAGVAVGIGRVPYLAGAASSLADTALRVVDSGGLTLVHDAARHGAPRRAVRGLAALVGLLLPGVTALLLVLAARGTLRLRSIVGALLALLGLAAFFYLPAGPAAGVALLALAAAGVALAATGPLVAAPLVALAALIATEYLPRLLDVRGGPPGAPVAALHAALFAAPGSPLWLRALALVVAAIPFAVAARLVVR